MKILIATKNMAKFEIISKMLNSILDNNELVINSLNDVNEYEEKEETGNNIERAKQKALDAFDNVNEQFDYILGIDDGIIINDIEYASVKDHLNDILINDNVPVDSKIYITRAYYLISKSKKEKYCYNKIPYIVKRKLSGYEIKGYPLNAVLSTIDNETVLTERNEEELNDYFLKYSIDDLKNLLSDVRGNLL